MLILNRTNPLPFPAHIDSTMRASAVSCETQFYWQWLRRLTLSQKSIDLIAGGAFATGLQVFRELYYTENIEVPNYKGFHDLCEYEAQIALVKAYGDNEPPEKNPKTCANMQVALHEYLQQYPPHSDWLQPHRTADGEPMIEFTFAIPIPDTVHPETGDPVLYAGRSDMIGVHTGMDNMLFVTDEKTTKSLGNTWPFQWDLRGQFLGYVWAAREMGNLPVVGTVVRGVGILKTKITFAEALPMPQDWQIARYIEQLSEDVNRLIRAWKAGRFSQAFDQACSQWGGCAMKPLCMTNQPEKWVSNFYVRNDWDPLRKNPEEESL